MEFSLVENVLVESQLEVNFLFSGEQLDKIEVSIGVKVLHCTQLVEDLFLFGWCSFMIFDSLEQIRCVLS